MAWLKHIDLLTGKTERRPLQADSNIALECRRRRSNPMGLQQVKGSIRVYAEAADDGVHWFCSPAAFRDPSTAGARSIPGVRPPPAQKLVHGATLNTGEGACVFLEYAEHRDPGLEAAASSESESAVETWTRWLEANGDPFASPMRAMLAGKVFGGRERWWLEGCDRGMPSVGAAFEMRGGFLRRVELRGGTLPLDLQVLHLLTLRCACSIEDLTLDLHGFLYESFWLPFARSDFWETAPWPKSLRVLRLSTADSGARLPRLPEFRPIALRQAADEIRAKMRGVLFEP